MPKQKKRKPRIDSKARKPKRIGPPPDIGRNPGYTKQSPNINDGNSWRVPPTDPTGGIS